MALQWTRLHYSVANLYDADVAKDSSGKEVGRVSRRPWPNIGFEWTCADQSGTARNVTEAKRAVLGAYVRTGAP